MQSISWWLIAKYLITVGIIVAVSEVAKCNNKLGALLVALPTATVLAMICLYIERQPSEKIANHALFGLYCQPLRYCSFFR